MRPLEKRRDQLVAELEEGGLALEPAIERYQEGIELLKILFSNIRFTHYPNLYTHLFKALRNIIAGTHDIAHSLSHIDYIKIFCPADRFR